MDSTYKGTHLGTKFYKNKSVLTVEEFSYRRSNKIRQCIFIVSCSVCSKDTELFPYGSLKSSIQQLKRGSVPCQCSGSCNWTEDQYKIRIERVCKEKGFKFLGWVDGFNSAHKTKLKLYNPITDNTWKSLDLTTFFIRCEDPLIRDYKSNRHLSEEKHIRVFKATGKYPEGAKFKKTFKKINTCTIWEYYCPSCSNDQYVVRGFCSGEFEASQKALKAGAVPCRCNLKYKWTQDMMRFRLENIFKNEGGTFLNFVNNKNVLGKSKFIWECRNGHVCSTAIYSFISEGHRCRKCSQKNVEHSYNGYYPERVSEQDTLYIILFRQSYIKIGRSFKLGKRLGDLALESGVRKDHLEVLTTYKGTHEEVYRTEQHIHQVLESEGFYHEESSWSTETFHTESLKLAQTLLDKSPLHINC